MFAPKSCLLLALCAAVQMPMVSCNGCGDPSDRMTGTIPAPADAQTFTILVGRTTFRVPRTVRFGDGGGANYAGYLMKYQGFEGKSMRDYLAAQLPNYARPVNSQHPELSFDDARHRATLSYDSGEGLRHLEMYQDLLSGGALQFEADYRPLGRDTAIHALSALMDDVLPVKAGEPIPQGMGMGNSVLARSTLNDEVANAWVTIPLPGYEPGEASGLRIELVSEMAPGFSDALDATCHNGQLSQYDLGYGADTGKPDGYTIQLLRYREREVAGVTGGETVFLQTAPGDTYREAQFTFMTDQVYPPAGQATLTLRAQTDGLRKGNDLRDALAAWDGILASARTVPMPAPSRGVFQRAPPGTKQLQPCRSRPDVNLDAVPSPKR